MNARLIRNATLIIGVEGKNILVDPMLGKRGALGPFPMLDDDRSNPLKELPLSDIELKELINGVDALLLTHLHPDHWDKAAQNMLPKHIPVYCQQIDADAIRAIGFNNVIPVLDKTSFFDVEISRTEGKHGLDEIGGFMGEVCGYVLKTKNDTLYIAGDTIWCRDVEQALDDFSPNFVIVNGGGAKFNIGEHVTMNRDDIKKLADYYSKATIAIVHLEAVSPVREDRALIREFIKMNGLEGRVIIPEDGDYIV